MTDTPRERTEAVLLRWLSAMQQRNPSALAAMAAPNCAIESMMSQELTGREGIRQLYTQWFTGFPDFAVEAEETLIDGNKGALVLTVTGTDRGGFMGLPPTNRPFRLSGVIVLTIADGLVVSYRSVYDFTGLLVQVGILKAKPA